MLVLVTGAAGFIASNTIELLLKEGHQVIGIDDFSTGSPDNIINHINFDFIEGDYGDPKLISKLRVDSCMHFGGYISVAESIKKPEKYFNNNVGKTFSLLESLASTQFIFSSSCAASEPKNSPYALSKLMVEQALRDSNRFNRGILRYYNAAGATKTHPETHSPETHLIPLTIDAALNGNKLKIFGRDYDTPDGTCIRDYIHVLDLANAHIKLLDRLKWDDYINLNLGTGTGHSNLEIVKSVEKIIDRKIDLEFDSRREGDATSLVAKRISYTKRVLNWKPEYSLEDIIQDTWESRR